MPKPASFPRPAALDAHLGFWMRFVSNQVSQGFQQRLAGRGVTVADWVALRTLWDGDTSTHTQLIDALGMTKGAISKLVSRLEARGLVERRPSPSCGRDQALALTPAGRALVPELAALADANDAHFFGHLAPDDRDRLLAALQSLVQHHQLKELPTA